MSQASNYYYELLNKEQKKAYYAMKTGLTALETSFMVPRLTPAELADIYFLVRMDHPEIFYSVKFNYRYYPNSEEVEFFPEYLFPKAKIREHQQAMASRVKKLARQAEGLKTEWEKEAFIHDFICENVHYDKLKKPYSHEIIGSLGNGVAVCEGIAKAVKILCDALGIWCIVALCGNNPEKGIKYRHTWNVIRINGAYYHLDATFDNSLSHPRGLSVIRYDYFNLSDKQIYRDHEPPLWKLPECPNADHSWYREKKLSFTKLEDVEKRAQQAVKKKKPLVFHWRGGYLTKELLQEMLVIFKTEGRKKEQLALVSVNWAQAVIFLAYTEMTEEQKRQLTEMTITADEKEIIMENANEGEECESSAEESE